MAEEQKKQCHRVSTKSERVIMEKMAKRQKNDHDPLIQTIAAKI